MKFPIPPSTSGEMLKFFATSDSGKAEQDAATLFGRLASVERSPADAAALNAIERFGLRALWPEHEHDADLLELQNAVQHRIAVWYGEVQRSRSKSRRDRAATL